MCAAAAELRWPLPPGQPPPEGEREGGIEGPPPIIELAPAARAAATWEGEGRQSQGEREASVRMASVASGKGGGIEGGPSSVPPV